ncbi:PP2C family protein-serine/threonine phosphatase [Streptomyces sp. MUM 2J]|uniref:PP2C family protein-serine/threonine phosphatase n=1 Tax=Streptomyces sp. MUM 2J TaxID=2791987 RepID=UPI0035ABE4BC
MFGVVQWIRSRPGTAAAAALRGRGSPAASLGALRAAMAGVGTTLDEATTWAELTRTAAARTGGAAAVVRRTDRASSGYEAIAGNAELLPDARWAAVRAVRSRAEPVVRRAPDRPRDPGGRPFRRSPSGRPEPPPGTGRDRRAADGRTGDPTTRGPFVCRVPLAVDGHSLGVLVCARRGRPFGRAETELLALLAEEAARHVRHAREYERLGRVVGDLQRALRAEPGRPHPNLDVAVRYLPAGHSALVGGDWCETVRLHFGRTLLVVGDVMGHGVEAAVDMTAYRTSLRSVAAADLPPHRVLRQLDDLAATEAERRPATCLLARVDPVRRKVTLAGAGHLPPAVISRQGEAALLPLPVGPPLGTGLGGYEPATYDLGGDQTLLLFTDGLVERRGEDIDVGLARLAGIRFPGAADLEEILDTVLARLDARHAEDDVAVLAARLHQRPGDGRG